MNIPGASATTSRCATVAAVVPYCVWMGLMFALPATASGYAVRSALTAAALAVFLRRGAAALVPWWRSAARGWGWGTAAGLLVLALWVLPEWLPAYRGFSLSGWLGLAPAADAGDSPYDAAVCGWPLSIVRLCGSALIIAPVEELFFRSFLYRYLQSSRWLQVPLSRFDFNAFAWTVAVFALEHHTRLAAGALAGAIYGLLAIRQGVGAAIIAHACTNSGLGLVVLATGRWDLW